MNGYLSATLSSNRSLTFAAGAVVAIYSALVVWRPLLALAIASGILVVVLGLHFFPSPQHFFLAALGLLLAGYAFLGKGFAYLPAKPVFGGEIVLALGILAALLGGKTHLAFRSPLAWLVLAFAIDGALRTAPYASRYGLDALRDAVIWGYGAFAILVAACLLQLECVRGVVERYRRWFPWLLFWLPVGYLAVVLIDGSLPVVSHAPPVTLLQLKPGDVAVQLAGVGCFIALGLYKSPVKPSTGLRPIFWWLAWLIAAALVVSMSRGAFLAIFLPVAFAFFLRPLAGWAKPAAMAVILAAGLFALNLRLDTGAARKVSVEQIERNLASIVGDVPATSPLLGTRRWRLEWWRKIIDYTVFGKHFWTGKGFGINLADSDGFQVTADHALRSPHDAHATILARMGVPGLALWLLLQGAFGLSLLWAYFRARVSGQDWWSRVDLWILAFWLAFMVNGTFDVFLEGPQGGIWFWSLFGLGIAALEIQKRLPPGRQTIPQE